MCQNMGAGRSDVEPLEYAFDGGEVLGIGLSRRLQRWVIGIPEQVADLAAKGKGGHILLRGEHILVNHGGSGLHRVGHLVCDIAFDHGSGVGRYKQPQQGHSNQDNRACDDSDPHGKFFVFYESHQDSSFDGKNFGRAPCPYYNILRAIFQGFPACLHDKHMNDFCHPISIFSIFLEPNIPSFRLECV